MKSVLCFGDSLTWGSTPGSGARHAYQDRWTSVLQKALGHGVRVIPEGLGGRTTIFDDYSVEADRNGARIIPTLLQSHSPLDLVILMLGTNDLKPHLGASALMAEKGLRRLVRIIQTFDFAKAGQTPSILLLSPPLICETGDEDMDAFMAPMRAQVKKLAPLYQSLAGELGCGFLDTASVAEPSSVDGVHLDAAQTRAIGEAVAPVAMAMLAD